MQSYLVNKKNDEARNRLLSVYERDIFVAEKRLEEETDIDERNEIFSLIAELKRKILQIKDMQDNEKTLLSEAVEVEFEAT